VTPPARSNQSQETLETDRSGPPRDDNRHKAGTLYLVFKEHRSEGGLASRCPCGSSQIIDTNRQDFKGPSRPARPPSRGPGQPEETGCGTRFLGGFAARSTPRSGAEVGYDARVESRRSPGRVPRRGLAGLPLILLALGWTGGGAGHAAPDSAAGSQPLATALEERVGVYLVEMSVLATDSTGAPITDLRADEIVVRERGEPQRLAFFQRHRREPATTPLPDGRIHFVGPDGREPRASSGVEPRWFFFLFDLVHGDLRTREDLRRAALEFIEQRLPDGDLAAIGTFSGRLELEQNFTDDRAALGRGVQSAFSRDALPRDWEARMRELLAVVEDCQLQIAVQGSYRTGQECMSAAVRNYMREIHGGTEAFIDGIETVVRLLAGVQGQKYVLLFSHGVSLEPADEAVEAVRAFAGANWELEQLRFELLEEVEYRRGFFRAIEKAVRGDVAIFTIDGSRQPTADFDGSSRQRYRQGARPFARAFETARGGLDELSRNTGGRFYGGSDFLGDLERALRATEGAYRLGYYTDLGRVKKLDKFVEVSAKCLRRGCSVATRDGFYFEPRRGDATLGRLDLGAAEVEQGRSRVPFAVTLDPAAFDRVETATEVGVNFTLHLRLLTADGAPLADSFHFLSHAYERSTYERGAIVAPRYQGELELPPGRYLFSVVLRDPQAFTFTELTELVTAAGAPPPDRAPGAAPDD